MTDLGLALEKLVLPPRGLCYLRCSQHVLMPDESTSRVVVYGLCASSGSRLSPLNPPEVTTVLY